MTLHAKSKVRFDYGRCEGDPCGRPDCPQCFPERAMATFLAEVRDGRNERSRGLCDRPVLLYHIPRSGGTFLAYLFEQLEILLVRPDFPSDAAVLDQLLHRGERRGLVILAHSAAAVKARNPGVDFLEFAACWRDPFEICASEFRGIREAPPGNHLFTHHLHDDALRCPSVADWVERFARANPVSNVLGTERPTMLRASHYAQDVAGMLRQVIGKQLDLIADYRFDPSILRPGRYVAGATRDELRRMRELNRRDYELFDAWVRQGTPAGVC